MNRREFVLAVAGASAGMTEIGWPARPVSTRRDIPAYSVTPVVGDGKWIWNKPPEDATGYLEPRSYQVELGIELEGVGSSTQFMSTTPALVEHDEQKVVDSRVEATGCQASIRQLTGGAAQLFVRGALQKGQRARATAIYDVKLFKQYQAHSKDRFPAKQQAPMEVRRGFLQDSPGIQTRSPQVRQLAAKLADGVEHPWDCAVHFSEWIRRSIRPQIGSYTSVLAALKNMRGDCEEMAAVFVALCRAIGLPARLVWVPNHNWAEFYLTDHDGRGHWIPVHTASYFWFGWTGAHELVLQKGDRVDVPETRGKERLLRDWMRYTGRAPRVRYVGRLTPMAAKDGEDAGPGARQKDEKGEWQIVGTHELDRYMRR